MWISVFLLCLFTLTSADEFNMRAEKLMSTNPLIDGHNDLPWQLLVRFNNQLNQVDLNTFNGTHTNIPKLKRGLVGGLFWAAYTPCDTQYKDAVRQTLDQIDVIHRMCKKYPETFAFAETSDDIMKAFKAKKVASLIGIEGGHSIDSSMATLRLFYSLGVRYMTLTHGCNTPWADNWKVDAGTAEAENNGLSDFGKKIIKEMNRLGMIVDLAHVSVKTMSDALEVSEAPIIFSHSSAYTLCNHARNVPDNILKIVKEKKGVVMVNFYNYFVTCSNKANLSDVADHFDYIKKVAGYEAVGFGGDYDGVESLPIGLEDVSFYPDLVAELLRRNWTDVEVEAALGGNLLRVFKAVENVKNNTFSDDTPIPYDKVQNPCRTAHGYSNQSNTGITLRLLPASVALAALTRYLLV